MAISGLAFFGCGVDKKSPILGTWSNSALVDATVTEDSTSAKLFKETSYTFEEEGNKFHKKEVYYSVKGEEGKEEKDAEIEAEQLATYKLKNEASEEQALKAACEKGTFKLEDNSLDLTTGE